MQQSTLYLISLLTTGKELREMKYDHLLYCLCIWNVNAPAGP